MSKTFLVIDADADGRTLLVGTLMRVFSNAVVTECQDAEMALKLITGHTYDAVISHRAIGADPETLVRMIRQERPNVPLLAVSGSDRRKELVAAGATEFLGYEKWLLVGRTVAEMIAPEPKAPFELPSLPRISTIGLVGITPISRQVAFQAGGEGET